MPALLLRLLLIATLILNGSGAAMASVRMAHQLASLDSTDVSMPNRADTAGSVHTLQAAGTRAADARDAASPSCHDMPGMQPAGVSAHGASQATNAVAAERGADSAPHQPSPSHCDAGSCQCACLHLVQAMTTLPRVPALAVGASTLPRLGIDTHADPALPHLIRPPIA